MMIAKDPDPASSTTEDDDVAVAKQEEAGRTQEYDDRVVLAFRIV